MPSDSSARLPRSKRLTPSRIMTSIAFLALAFAFLPTILSPAFAVSVLGILVLDGMAPLRFFQHAVSDLGNHSFKFGKGFPLVRDHRRMSQNLI
jgi:hypothetical protein